MLCFGVLCMQGSIALLLAHAPAAYLCANIGFSIFFRISIPYLLGVASEMDNSGQLAAFAGFISSIGLATGPAVTALILGDGQFERIVWFAQAMLPIGLLLVAQPAQMLDNLSRNSRVIW